MSATVQDLSGKTFDYIIIGGGTAGLTIAARLSEDPHISVAVLEAGIERFDDPLISTIITQLPAQFGKHFGDTRYTWNFKTVPQLNSNNHSFLWPRGKVLGGTSAINFFFWNKPPAADIDIWEAMGNPGWNWARFNEYSKKAEGFVPPSEEYATKYRQKYNIDTHGTSGPVKTAFPQLICDLDVPFQQALMNAGIKVANDPQNGDPIGTFMALSSMTPETQTRSYSATAFYQPNAERPNLHVLCGAVVHRLIVNRLDNTHACGDLLKAHAVEFECKGDIHSVYIGKEVILSAGALKSPQILELSGIGSREILDPLGIETIVNLPGVGSNMQEHMLVGIIYELDPKYRVETLDNLADPEYAKEHLALHALGKGTFRLNLSSFTFLSLLKVSSERARDIIRRQRQLIETREASRLLSEGMQEQYKHLLSSYEEGGGGECEIICFPGWFGKGAPEAGKNYVTLMTSFNRPFSRGTIHIDSKDPNAQSQIDPHYFEESIDIEAMTESIKFIRKVSELEPFKNFIAREVVPGSLVIGDGPIQEFLKDNVGTTYHTASTLSMLPRKFGGVVDPNLRVYGTENIRVADMSIVPLHVASHTQSIAYAIGEQAADIIRGSIAEVK